MRKDRAFYWLAADQSVSTGLIAATYDEESNTVYLEALEEPDGEIMVLANPMMMDFDRPLTIVTKDDEMSVDLKAKRDVMERSIRETGDVYLSWADEISVIITDF